jgi:hypothetical protein
MAIVALDFRICITIPYLFATALARAMRIPADATAVMVELALPSHRVQPIRHAPISGLHQRDTKDSSTCGGDSSLFQCGAPFPSDFCCPSSTTCLRLDSSVISVLCCPAGLDCKFISPISCDEQAQNATMFPGNQLHSEPTMPLGKCGDSCCPVGATCHDSICAVSTATLPTTNIASSSQAPVSTSTGRADDTASSSSLPAVTPQASIALDGASIVDGSAAAANDAFSGKSFVAGLFPGIVVGALVVTILIWCLDRRRRRSRENHPDRYSDHKHFSTTDQLTSLSTDSHQALPKHTRSISEPVSDPSNGQRTYFVRRTPSPPRGVNPLNHNAEGYVVSATGPLTPARTSKMRMLSTRSSIFHSPPSPQISHFPSHTKRGTISHAYTISPIRALRSKKSSHSLRRQRTASAAIPNANPPKPRNQYRPRASTSASTETIRVLMPQVELEACTPDQRTLRPPVELDTIDTQGASHPDAPWTTVSYSPLFPEPIRLPQLPQSVYETPTRVPASQARTADQALGTQPRAVWKDGERLSVEADLRRQTTFSGFMERAGVKPSGL